VAFEDLQDALSGLLGKAGSLGDGLADLGSKALQAATGFDSAANRFRNAQGQFQAAGSALQGFVAGGLTKAAGALNATVPAIDAVGGALMSMATGPIPSTQGAAKMLGDALGGALTGAADKAAEGLSKLGPEGAAAGAALQALSAVVAATVGQLVSLAGLAIQSAQGADLMRDRFAALAGSAAGGKEVQASIAKLAATLPFAKGEVNSWAQSLLAAGVKGQQLEADIKAIAAATALMGESGGAAAQTLFKRLGEGGPAADKLLKTFQDGGPKADKLLKEMGLSLADLGGQAALAKMSSEELHQALSKAMAKKGAGPLADLALTLPAILTKAQEGIRSLFGDLGPAVKTFMTAVKGLFGEFNKGSPTINALKPVVTAIFSTLFSWATKAVTAIRGVIQSFTGAGKGTSILSGAIGVLKAGWTGLVAIAKVVWAALSPIVGMLKAIFSNAMVLNGIKTIFTVIAAVIVVAITVIAAFIGIVATIAGVVAGAVGALVGLASGALGAASDFVTGLVEGISAGAGAVADAVKGLASGALSAFTGALGIHSPSTIMLEHGEENIAGAAATGIEAGTPKVAKAMGKMGEAEPGTPKGGARKGSGGDSGGGGERHYHYHGPMSDYETFRKYVVRYWEEAELEAGSAPEPA
jgi:phage-related protein